MPYQARGESQGIKRRVIVLPFLNISPYPSDRASDIARTTLVNRLIRSGEVVPISLREIPEDVSKYQSEDHYEIKKLLPMARKSGAHAILVGRIKELKTKKVGDSVGVVREVRAEVSVLVDLKMYSTKNGDVMLEESKMASIEEGVTRVARRSYTDKELQDNPVLIQSVVTAAFQKITPAILRVLGKLDWEGRIALVRGERVYLNAGRRSGIQIGDILKITEMKEEVYDPESGKFLGKIKGRTKGTVEVISYFGKDGSVTIVHSGSGFKENDIAEFY